MKENNGIVYKISNLINGKVYIGKTKEYRGDSVFGINGRFEQHKKCAILGKYGCPLLNNAIRKYGPENFVIEKLLNCSLEEVDDKEIETIKQYDSTNRDIGYNIALGGGGRSVVHVPEEARINISKAQGGNGAINIKEYHIDDKLVGYTVRRREKGKHYQKWFTSQKNTPEENLESANKWIESLKNNTLDNNAYNKSNKLPRNISYDRNNKKEIAGYKVTVMKDGIKSNRSFMNTNETMEERLQKAIRYRDSVLNNNPIEKATTNSKHCDLPKNVNIAKNKKGEIIGYTGKVIVNKKVHMKQFIKVDVPMKDKLKQAIEYVNGILSTK
jgi:hypothetical protein